MARPTFDAARFPFPDGEMHEWMTLGGISHRRIRAWLRTPHAEPRNVRVFDGDRQVAESSVTPAAAADWTASVDLDLPYGVDNRDLRVQSGELERTFRAAPVEGEPRSFAFWFGSCHQPYDVTRSGEVRDSRRSGIYDAIRTKIDQHNASFGILLGDQMYADEVPGLDIREWANDESPRTPAAALDVYRHLYRGFFNHRGMRQLQEARPTFLVWDDHEIFNSWGSYLSVGDSDQMLFEAASQAYREYQHTRNPGTAVDDPAPYCYQFWFADTGFFVFDLRGERDYRNGRVVSDHQWKLFDEFLREASHRDVKTVFVVTSVPLVHFSPALVRMVDWIPARHGENARDRWDARDVQEERDRLEHRLFEWQSSGTRRQPIVISGDVHSGAAFTVTHKNGPGQFHQWTSSALTSPGGPVHVMASTVGTRLVNVGEDDSHAERKGLLGSNNFGLVRVRPLDEGGHLITFRAFPYRARFHRLGHPRKAIAVPPEA